MKKVESATSLAVTKLNRQIQTRKGDKFFAEKAGALSTLMAGTHGRDKMCALIQYAFLFFHECAKASEDPAHRDHWSTASAEKVSKNISMSRKMLKFLNFVEAI